MWFLAVFAFVGCGGDDGAPEAGTPIDALGAEAGATDGASQDVADPGGAPIRDVGGPPASDLAPIGDGQGAAPDDGDDGGAPPGDTAADAHDLSDIPCDGCFGAPCDGHDDCVSGWCLDGPDGLACSQTCLDTCPAPYTCRQLANELGDPVFVCTYDHLAFCAPCDVDRDCAALGLGAPATCLEADDGSFCATPCRAGCPDGARCQGELCVPEGGCGCSRRAIDFGATTACARVNEHGACDGVRACVEGGLSDCDATEPAAEICNDLDDDCDGEVDEGFEQQGEACDGGDEDLCADGVLVCGDDGALQCSDSPESRPEICNDLDDDCDGVTDEGYEAAKGQPCDGNDADLCADGAFVCDQGGLRCDDDEASVEEVCNGVDDDCDGRIDEDTPQLGQPCDGDDTDACPDGVFVCDAGGLRCEDDVDDSVVERCNGLDDDCDGATDEDFPVARSACDPGGACMDGAWACEDDEAVCVATVRANCCGNGLQEGAERCDGDCPRRCDDGNPCTADRLEGAAATCDARCLHPFDPDGPAGGDRCACVDASPAPEIRCLPMVEEQVWVGGYLGCPQGATDLALHVESIDGFEVTAIFEFLFVPDDAYGQFRVRGDYDPATRRLQLRPVEWLIRPRGYAMVGLNGVVTGDGEFYAGEIFDEQSTEFECRNFVVNLE